MITMQQAICAYRAGNNAGLGYEPGGAAHTIDEAVAYYYGCGAEIVLARATSDDVAVVNRYGQLIAIGGDAQGRNAWAVTIEVQS